MTFQNQSVFGNPNSNTTQPAAGPVFATPAAGDNFDIKANEGSLLLIKPTGFTQGINTSYGLADAVEATIGVVDGPNAGEIVEEALIFPKVLQGQLKKHIGKAMVPGRLGKGTAKPGQSAPWLLQDANEQDMQAVQQFYNQNTDKFA